MNTSLAAKQFISLQACTILDSHIVYIRPRLKASKWRHPPSNRDFRLRFFQIKKSADNTGRPSHPNRSPTTLATDFKFGGDLPQVSPKLFRVFRSFSRNPELGYYRCRLGYFLDQFRLVEACERPACGFWASRVSWGNKSSSKPAQSTVPGSNLGQNDPKTAIFCVPCAWVPIFSPKAVMTSRWAEKCSRMVGLSESGRETRWEGLVQPESTVPGAKWQKLKTRNSG